jgi:hypothetical protein
MNILKVLVLFFIFIFTSLSIGAQNPWLHKKKDGYIQVQGILPAYQYSSTLNGFFLSHEQAVNRKTFNSDYSIYLEYGILDNLNLISVLPFKYVSTGDLTSDENELPFDNVLEEGSLSGMGNYRFALKYGLGGKKANFAISVDTRWNTISQELEKGLSTGIDANAFGLVLHAGRGNSKHYGFAAVGFYKYTNNYSDVIEINVEHGWKLKERWNVALSLDGRFSLYNGSYFNGNLDQTGLYPNNQEWLAISAKASYELKNNYGINAAFPLVPIYFNRVGFNGTLAMGLYKKF